MEREGESEINGYPEAEEEEEEKEGKSKQEILIRSLRSRWPVHERGQ